jgi:hypothetical protein
MPMQAIIPPSMATDRVDEYLHSTPANGADGVGRKTESIMINEFIPNHHIAYARFEVIPSGSSHGIFLESEANQKSRPAPSVLRHFSDESSLHDNTAAF